MRRYSSGMNARLGFAIAAHLEPDVLIVDEVLSVGDFAFQQRAYARLQEMVNQDVTTIIVSHQLERVASVQARGAPASGRSRTRRACGRDHRGLCEQCNRGRTARPGGLAARDSQRRACSLTDESRPAVEYRYVSTPMWPIRRVSTRLRALA